MRIEVPQIHEIDAALDDVSILSFVQSGGFKAVFKGIPESGIDEAIKAIYLPPETWLKEGQKEQLVARAKREIEALKLCNTPSIVKLGSLDPRLVEVNEEEYLVYSEEFLPGHPLSEDIANACTPSLAELLTLMDSLLAVMKEMIRIDFLHRDIKPANIMATGDPKRPYVVLDMGIAFKIDGTELTLQNAGPPGTLRYMAPELLKPDYKESMDFRCDLYSTGLSIYEMASGIHPFAPKPEEQYATMYRILKEKPEKLESLRPDLPVGFCRIVDRCIRKAPALRYANLELLEKDLEMFL